MSEENISSPAFASFAFLALAFLGIVVHPSAVLDFVCGGVVTLRPTLLAAREDHIAGMRGAATGTVAGTLVEELAELPFLVWLLLIGCRPRRTVVLERLLVSDLGGQLVPSFLPEVSTALPCQGECLTPGALVTAASKFHGFGSYFFFHR